MSANDEALQARGSLQQALTYLDRDNASEPADLARISELWQGMTDGSWSVVEHFVRDGYRYVLAQRASDSSDSVAQLSSREWQALALANQGLSNKVIAQDLGLSASTVSTYLARARKKLRARQSLLLGNGRAPREARLQHDAQNTQLTGSPQRRG